MSSLQPIRSAAVRRARSADAGDEPGSSEAVEALCRWKRIEAHPDLMRKIGLVEVATNGGWHATRKVTYREAFAIRLLFDEAPEEFASAIASILRTGGYLEAAQVYGALSAENATGELLEALVARAHQANQPYSAETEPLEILSSVAPTRFVAEFSPFVSGELHARARETIADCYAEHAPQLGADLLVELIRDPAHTPFAHNPG